jgi:hypothetical protein
MKPRFRFSLLIVLLLLVSILGVSLTSAHAPQNYTPSNLSSQLANSPWRGQLIQSSQDPPLNFGAFISLVTRPFDDQPNIAHYRVGVDQLILASPNSGNCGVNGNWRCTTLEYGGQYLSMDIFGTDSDNYKVAISYYNVTSRDLRLYYFQRIAGVNSVDKITVQSPVPIYQSIGLYTSIKFSPTGVPGIMYHVTDSVNGDSLRYAYPVDSGGNCGLIPYNGLWQCDIVDSGPGVGQYASFDFSYDGQPSVAYYDAGAGNLKYAYFGGIGDCWNSNGWICPTIDGTDGSDVGRYASLKAPDRPSAHYSIAYYDKTNGYLKFFNPDFGEPVVVDDMTTVGFPVGISMDIDKFGYPVIAYQQTDEFAGPKLGLARPYFVYDDGSFGNCGDVPPGYLFQYWRCNTLVYSGQYTEVGDVISLSVKSNGFLEIAYSEFDTYYLNTDLKIIYQYSQTFMPLLIKP